MTTTKTDIRHKKDTEPIPTPTGVDPEAGHIQQKLRDATPKTSPPLDDRRVAEVSLLEHPPLSNALAGDDATERPNRPVMWFVVALLILIAILVPVVAALTVGM